MEASNLPVSFDGNEPIDDRLQLDSSITDKTEQYRAAFRDFFIPNPNDK